MPSLELLLQQHLSTHSLLVIALAFLGGVVSSLLPCTVSMLPVLVGYVGGFSEDSRLAVFRQAGLFIVGLALTLTVLGILASVLGLTFGTLVGDYWYFGIGILAILMGLQLLNIIHIHLPQFMTKLPQSPSGKLFAPLLLGVAFGAASSPCGTPFLAAILGFISREHNIALGGASLFSYALGQGVLLLVVGMFTGLLKHLAVLRHVGGVVTRLSAGLFIIVGVMLLAAGTGLLFPVMSALHLL